MKIEPKENNMKIKGILGKYDIVGTVYILTKKEKLQKLEKMINDKIEFITSGTSILLNESGIIVKILSNSTEEIYKKIYEIVKITRKEILGTDFTKIRKN